MDRLLMLNKFISFTALTAVISTGIGIIVFSGSLSAQTILQSIPKTITIKTDVITMKGQRSGMDNRIQLRIGEINNKTVRTQPIIYSGQRKINQ